MKESKKTRTILFGALAALGLIAVFVGGIILGRYLENRGFTDAIQEDAYTTVELAEEESDDAQIETSNADDASSEDVAASNEGSGEFGAIESGETIEASVEPEEILDDSELQVVVLGDSIFDMNRDGTGIPFLIGEQLNARVYNLAIGGSSATVEDGEETSNEAWTSTSGIGIAKAVAGQIDVESLRDCTAKELIRAHQAEFQNTDIFIVEYGINDFLAERAIGNGNYGSDYHFFVTAMLGIVDALREAAPEAKIVLCEPHYCDFYGKDGAYVGSSNMVSNIYGTLYDYKGKVDYVANTRGTYLFEAYLNSGINGYTAADYLLDGIHMSEAGRRRYAEELAGYIKRNILMTEPPREE